MKLKPLNDNLVVRRKEPTKVSAGGIILPDAAQERSAMAEVLAVGPGASMPDGTRRELGVKPGEVVLFDKYAGTELRVDDELLLLLSGKEVLGIVEG